MLSVIREYRLTFVTTVCVAHWLFVTAFAALATRYAYTMPAVPAVGYRLPELDGWRRYVIQPLRNWDGFWYSMIATEGYGWHPASTAFWPLYPWTMRLLSEVTGMTVEVAGLILANAAFVAAMVVLYRLVLLEWGETAARRTVILLAAFPTSFYFSAVYSESFFLLFCVLSFYWGRTERWWLAGLAGAMAALTRNLGVVLVVPLAIMYLQQHGWNPRAWSIRAAATAIPVLGPAIYFTYLQWAWGDALLTLEVQQGWGRQSAMPWDSFAMAFEQWNTDWLRLLIDNPGWATLTSFEMRHLFAEYESLDIIIVLLMLPLVGYCVARLPLEYSVFVLALAVPPLFNPSVVHPLMSYPRFVIVMFPLFIALAIVLRGPKRFLLYMCISLPLLAVLTMQFATWFWVA